ncbi:MAG: selenium metabolism-associated LysR family transcriptional regulator [Desulfitobacteriaceae bacterium]|nr:selenium metabolism-associated LysR family transcriptional regulator [Desulfitobacteriaceae bacterium]MDI6914044.1 selenium metabolism-associated LysR family transcriptional regulator [Desulfitobacteriaceae bacterium]
MLELLKLFVQVVEEQSFTTTARRLGVSQPAVSNQMRVLEEKLGAKLLYRRGKALVLTQEGEVTLRQARLILEHWHQLVEDIGAVSSEVAGTVRMGASHIPGEYLLPFRLAQFGEQYPKVKFRLYVGDSLEMANKVLEQEVDFAVVGSAFDSDRLMSEFWREDELMLVLPKSHPLVEREEVGFTELMSYPMILREGGSGHRRALEEKLALYGSALDDFQVSLEAGSIEAVKNAIRAGMGYSFVSRSALDVSIEGLVVRTLSGIEVKRGFYLVSQRSKPLPTVAQACYRFLASEASPPKRTD